MALLKKVNENLKVRAEAAKTLETTALAGKSAPGPVPIEVFRGYVPLPPPPVLRVQDPQPTTVTPPEASPPPKRSRGRPLKQTKPPEYDSYEERKADLTPGEKVKKGPPTAIPGVVRNGVLSFGVTALERSTLIEEAAKEGISVSSLVRQAVWVGLGIEPPHPESVDIQRQGPRIRGEWLEKLAGIEQIEDPTRFVKTLHTLIRTKGEKEATTILTDILRKHRDRQGTNDKKSTDRSPSRPRGRPPRK